MNYRTCIIDEKGTKAFFYQFTDGMVRNYFQMYPYSAENIIKKMRKHGNSQV